jgi:hypothetical protein
MIALHSDCLLFQLPNGECVPCTTQMISVEIVGEPQHSLDNEMLQHAASSVFHYFKAELERETVTAAEFSYALEKVLLHLGYTIHAHGSDPRISETDLGRLAHETGDNLELLFFPRLRDELRQRLQHSPRVLHFRGLRGCVKRIAGARRWSSRCEALQDQIVAFLRECLSAEPDPKPCALVVE